MLSLIAIAYWLMCVRLKVCVEASLREDEGSVALSIGACGVMLRYDARLMLGREGALFRLTPRYPGKRRKESGGAAQRQILRLLEPYLKDVLLGRRFDRIVIRARLGLADAAQTALLCGAMHALLCALLSSNEKTLPRILNVQPDFSGGGLCMFAQGIFSCQAGDIMLAARKGARRRKTGKEGFRWKSIPLRA